MEQLFTTRPEMFDSTGAMKCSVMRWFLDELYDMKVAYRAGDKEKALQHENNAMWAIYFTDHKDVVNDMEYELYISDCTQMHHPKRKLTVRKDD